MYYDLQLLGKLILQWLQQTSHLEVFTQPTVARSIIELPANAEKGLSQQFIWTFPKPTYADFETLEPVDASFSSALGKNCIMKCYRSVLGKHLWVLKHNPQFKPAWALTRI